MGKYSFINYIQNEAINIPKSGKALFDPSAKTEIEQSTYSVENILPEMDDHGKRYLELMIEGTYEKLLERIKKYTNTPTPDRLAILTAMHQSIDTIHRIEKNHVNHLENLALQTVLELEEYKFIKDLIKDRKVVFDVKIIQPDLRKAFEEFNQKSLQDGQNAKNDELTRAESAEFDAIEMLMQPDMSKAAFADFIAQGESMNSMEMFKLAKSALDKIDSRLCKLYELYSVSVHVAYFMLPFVDMNGYIDQSAGMANVTPHTNGPGDDDDYYKITAHGINFATLFHEIVKGVYTYIGLNAKNQDILDREDLNDEKLQLMAGPELATRFRNAILDVIGVNNIEYLQPMYGEINSVDTDGRTIKSILAKSPESRNLIKQIFNKVKTDLDNFNEN